MRAPLAVFFVESRYMNETITSFLLQYGIPGLVILLLIWDRQDVKKEFAEREKIWIEREKLWHAEQKQDRDTLLNALNSNTDIIAKLQVMERINAKTP